MTKMMKRFAADQSGATAIEYGLLASLIAIGLIAASGKLATSISGTFNYVGTQLKQS